MKETITALLLLLADVIATGGSGAGVSTGSTIWQFNLGGSLNFKLK